LPYKNLERRRLSDRGSVRTHRHGNWRQTYIDCFGMCIAQVNGSGFPCGATESLELHEEWGESKDSVSGKFQRRMLLCNFHHSLVDDRCHQSSFVLWQPKPSRLQEDVTLEIMLAGSVKAWAEKWGLDMGREGCMLFDGPHVEDYE